MSRRGESGYGLQQGSVRSDDVGVRGDLGKIFGSVCVGYDSLHAGDTQERCLQPVLAPDVDIRIVQRWPLKCAVHRGPHLSLNTANNYSFSNPWLLNFSVRPFSVTVRTTCSDAPSGILASISSVTVTFAPTLPVR